MLGLSSGEQTARPVAWVCCASYFTPWIFAGLIGGCSG